MGTRIVVRLAIANNINEGNDTIITAHVFEGQSDPSLKMLQAAHHIEGHAAA